MASLAFPDTWLPDQTARQLPRSVPKWQNPGSGVKAGVDLIDQFD